MSIISIHKYLSKSRCFMFWPLKTCKSSTCCVQKFRIVSQTLFWKNNLVTIHYLNFLTSVTKIYKATWKFASKNYETSFEIQSSILHLILQLRYNIVTSTEQGFIQVILMSGIWQKKLNLLTELVFKLNLHKALF